MATSEERSLSTGPDASTLRRLAAGTLEDAEVQRLQRAPKDADRFHEVLAAVREGPLGQSVVLPLQEHLCVVETENGLQISCDCGHRFGAVSENWKLAALVYERDPSDGTVLAPVRSADPDWMILREFYCPGCAAQLEVEAVPPGHPFVFSAVPRLDADG